MTARKSRKKAAPVAGLHLTGGKAELVHLLDSVGRVAAKSSSAMPVLAGARLELKGNKLTAVGSDLDLYVKVEASVEGKTDGVVVVAAKPLAELIKTCPTDSVELVAEKDRLQLTAGGFSAKVPLFDASDFPTFPKVEGDPVVWDVEPLEGIVRRVRPFTSRDENLPILTSVLVTGEKEVAFVATDRYRLAEERTLWDGPEQPALITGRTLDEVVHMAAAEKATCVEATFNGHVRFRVGTGEIVARLTEGQFPNYGVLVPDSFAIKVKVNRSGLADIIRRMQLVTRGVDEAPVRLGISQGEAVVSAGSDAMFEGTETIPVDLEGEGVLVAFNAKFLAEVLSRSSDEFVEILLNDGVKPGEIRFGSLEQYRHLLMPIRVDPPVKLASVPDEPAPEPATHETPMPEPSRPEEPETEAPPQAEKEDATVS